jgi:hypothetical protein
VPVPTGDLVSAPTEYPINLAVDEPTGTSTLFLRPGPAHAASYTVFLFSLGASFLYTFLAFFPILSSVNPITKELQVSYERILILFIDQVSLYR